MTAGNGFLKGVIEGFYGRPWSFETRLAYAGHLAHLGLNTYLYCPKADPYLRRQWHKPWPRDEFQQLQALSSAYAQRSLNFGVGLSPFALYENYGATQRSQLQRKVEEINALHSPILAILFDDMPGEVDALASRQVEILADIRRWSNASRLLICPTYYSFDPVLPKYFGAMPENYWPQLGSELPTDVDIFWTGNKVCSEAIAVVDIARIEQQLGRRVLLWDNYPVNDGATRSNFLYGSKLANREAGLASRLSGHLCNPMNQGLLSLMAVQGLADLYGNKALQDSWVVEVWGDALYRAFLDDMDDFQHRGLSGMGSERCEQLAGLYGKVSGPAAQEVAGWLRGEYTFDPSCLTD